MRPELQSLEYHGRNWGGQRRSRVIVLAYSQLWHSLSPLGGPVLSRLRIIQFMSLVLITVGAASPRSALAAGAAMPPECGTYCLNGCPSSPLQWCRTGGCEPSAAYCVEIPGVLCGSGGEEYTTFVVCESDI